MSNPTSNFGWQMPTATDLVTDLPADFEVFGQAVDTDFIDLLGGTTGQILSKTSATDLDFTWINNDQGDITAVTAGTGITGGGTAGAVTITNDMATTITAAGDIVVGTGSGTYDNLPIGTTEQVLTADTTVSPYKVKWATPAPKVVQIVYGSTTTQAESSSSIYADTNLTATITPTSASNNILVMAVQNGIYKDTGNTALSMKLLRGATSIGTTTFVGDSGASVLFVGGTVAFQVLDSPATTSATTYKTQFISTGNTARVRVNYASALSTIILMEVTP